MCFFSKGWFRDPGSFHPVAPQSWKHGPCPSLGIFFVQASSLGEAAGRVAMGRCLWLGLQVAAVVQSLSCVWLFTTHELQHSRLLCPSLSPWVCSNSYPLSQWCMPSNHLILSHPLLFLPSIFPSIRVFSESALRIRWPNTGASASTSILPMNTQDWSPLGWTGLISLQSKGLSRVFSNTTVQKHQFSFLYSPTLTFTHDHWKNHSLD